MWLLTTCWSRNPSWPSPWSATPRSRRICRLCSGGNASCGAFGRTLIRGLIPKSGTRILAIIGTRPDEARHALRPLCINTTFYLTDNAPETGRLTFINNFCHNALPEEIRHLGGYNSDNPFYQWCERQEHIHLHPMTGDAVVFFSHIPHQGAKLKEDADAPIRGNVVLHYQQTPMFPGIPFVSSPLPAIAALGYNGTFPFAEGR